VLDGGDYFHVKAASRNPHALVSHTAAAHRKYPCPVWAILGNHDVTWNNLDTVDKQPIGVLFASHVFNRLEDTTFYSAGGVQVRVVGVSYNPALELADLLAIQKRPGDQYLVVVAHALATENTPGHMDEFLGEKILRYNDLVTPGGPDAWCFGHWHKDQGAVQVGGKWFVNQGAVSRGSLNADNLGRTPKVAVLRADSQGLRVELLPLKVAAAGEVFDFERKERVEQEARDIDQFVERLRSDASIDPNVSIEDNVRSLDFAVEVRDLALHYLELARTGGG
jgi:Icc-related predicted phosphoesterase